MSQSMTSPSLEQNPNCRDWLDLGRDGVVVLKSGKVEIGQGIATALVQIAADELDVVPTRVELISGHTALGPTEAGTSSSLSIETSGRAIRLAASATRALLVAEAAKLLQTAPASLAVVDGRIHRSGAPTDLTLWSLARSVDLAVPVSEHARPKAPADRRIAGTSLPRLDLPAKLAGPAFIHDRVLPEMMHGRVVQPPARGRTVVSFDERRFAATFPAVRLVRDGSFIGVLAEREELAVAAVRGAQDFVTWSPPLPLPATLREAIAQDPSSAEVTVTKGDVDAAQGQIYTIEVERPYIAHASLAPSAAIAHWRDGRLEVHSHSQAIHDMRAPLAKALGIAPEAIVIAHADGAGTYGHSGQDDVVYEAALLARAVPGRPVRLLWSRAEDFALSPHGPGAVVRAEAKVGASGRIEAYSLLATSQAHVHRPGRGDTVNFLAAERIAAPLPSSVASDVPLARGGGADRNGNPLYAIANVRVAKRILTSLPYRTSALRALGGFVNILALESLMDDIAHDRGIDPVRYRLDHLEDRRAAEVIETAAAMAEWGRSAKRDGEALGIGFGQYKNRSGYCAVVVRVVVDAEVRVTHAWSAVDAGEAINPDGIANQVEGGIVQAASWTLKERVAIDGDQVATRDWAGYPILRFSEVPEIAVRVIARPEMPPLGVGEVSTGPTGAAIANAVRAAIGVRVPTLPITREAVVAAIG